MLRCALLTCLAAVCAAHTYNECVEECAADDLSHGLWALNDTERVVGIVVTAYAGGVLSSLTGMVGLQCLLGDDPIRVELEKHERWFLSGALLFYIILNSERLSKYLAIKRVVSSLFIWYAQIFYHNTVLQIATLSDIYYNLLNLCIMAVFIAVNVHTLHLALPRLADTSTGNLDEPFGDDWLGTVQKLIAGSVEWIRTVKSDDSSRFLLKYYYILEPCRDSRGLKVFIFGTGAALTVISLPHEHHVPKGVALLAIAMLFAAAGPFLLHRDTVFTSLAYCCMGVRYLTQEDSFVWIVLLVLTGLKFMCDLDMTFVKVTSGRRRTIQYLYWAQSAVEAVRSQHTRHSVVSIDTTPEYSTLPLYALSMSDGSFAAALLPSPPKRRPRPTLLGKTRDLPAVVAVLAAAVAAGTSREKKLVSLMGALLTPPQPRVLEPTHLQNLELI